MSAVSLSANITRTLAKRGIYAGYGTVYTQDGLAGSCGEYYDDDAYICALSNDWMKDLYIAPECGLKIRVTNVGSDYGVGGVGNTIVVTVQDTCPTCDDNHVDFSVGAWNALTNGAPHGQLYVEWSFISDRDDDDDRHYGTHRYEVHDYDEDHDDDYYDDDDDDDDDHRWNYYEEEDDEDNGEDDDDDW
ncbi:hypothetical protein B0H63DRAFT_563786 [Podospora didyma]|uniref:RlpA-like protein double-psi beta-barrel domain-containing protein n=1 Tax=Podospora didyma TaxID=330526 RepID=A0AAE0N6W6_9PEZI|nr:hypothetical protein B0H63DRAFT_563786 [Podospora didyma]